MLALLGLFHPRALAPSTATVWWHGSQEALDLRALGNDLGMIGSAGFLVAAALVAVVLVRRDGRRALPGGVLLVAAAVPFLHGHIYWPAGGLAMVGVGVGCGLLAATGQARRADGFGLTERYRVAVASPAQSTDPSAVRPPDADPLAIRACLTPDVAAVFDAEWAHALDEAKVTMDLAGVRELLQHWRHFAYQELRDPGAYFRVLAVAARTLATRTAPPGSISGEEMRARLNARLAETRDS